MSTITRGLITGEWAVALLAGFSESASAQIGRVVYGRVEDALTRVPVVGALVMGADSASAVLTDLGGEFAFHFPPGAPLDITVSRQGYQTQSFVLPPNAAEGLPVILVEPAPIEMTGVEAISETDVSRLMRQLSVRRNSYPGSVRMYDKDAINRFMPVASVWEFLLTRVPVFECARSSSGLCTRGRGTTVGPKLQGANGAFGCGVHGCADRQRTNLRRRAAFLRQFGTRFPRQGRCSAD